MLRRPGTGRSLPLVLLHGLNDDASSWMPLIALLDPAIEAVAWDAPGFGASDPLAPVEPTSEDYAAALEMMLNVLGHSRVVLAGHSLGALFAGRFAASRPDRVAALALISPVLGHRTPVGTAAAGMDGGAKTPPWHRDLAPHTAGGCIVAFAIGCSICQGGIVQAAHAQIGRDLPVDAEAIHAPMLVAVGAEDRVTPPANANGVHAALNHAIGLEVVPLAGHMLLQERPHAVAQMLTKLVLEASGV